MLLLCTDGLALPLAGGDGDVGRRCARARGPPDIMTSRGYSTSAAAPTTTTAPWLRYGVHELSLRSPRSARAPAIGRCVRRARADQRFGGQGRVYRPALVPSGLGRARRRQALPPAALDGGGTFWARWSRGAGLSRFEERARSPGGGMAAGGRLLGAMPVGIALEDVSGRFAVPFVMPSGRRERVLMALEHLLGDDSFLELRGLGVRSTRSRAEVAERICEALGSFTARGSSRATSRPNNLLVSFGAGETRGLLHRLRLDGVSRPPGADAGGDRRLGHSSGVRRRRTRGQRTPTSSDSSCCGCLRDPRRAVVGRAPPPRAFELQGCSRARWLPTRSTARRPANGSWRCGSCSPTGG